MQFAGTIRKDLYQAIEVASVDAFQVSRAPAGATPLLTSARTAHTENVRAHFACGKPPGAHWLSGP